MRRPHDKQVAGASELDQNAVAILNDAQSELVRKEVDEKGGVQRGSQAAKIQVIITALHVLMPVFISASCLQAQTAPTGLALLRKVPFHDC